MIGHGLAFTGCAAATFATAGGFALLYGVGAVANGIAVGVNIAEWRKIKERLKFFKEELEKGEKQENEIKESLKEFEKKYLKLKERFIPINVK